MRAAALVATQARGFLEMTKPRLSSFVLIVVALSGWMAGGSAVVVFAAVVGTGLVAGGASALNMLIERDLDARMPRTWNRPLPSGRLQPFDVALFGTAITVAGLALLLWATTPLATALAALTSALYLGLYTPLKRVTTLNTHIGALPGALPALIGWTAVQGTIGPAAWALFLIVYLWQLPHFLAIAWMYRRDYARGGFRMLPSADPDGSVTGRQALLGSLALLPVSLMPVVGGACGWLYLGGAILLGLYFVHRALRFAMERNAIRARRLLRASLVYLPLLLLLLFLDYTA